MKGVLGLVLLFVALLLVLPKAVAHHAPGHAGTDTGISVTTADKT